MSACIMHVITSLKRGGAEAVVTDIVEQFSRDPLYKQVVIYSYEGPYVQQLQELGIDTYQIKGYFFRYDPIFWWRFYTLIRTIRPQLILSSLWVTNFTSRLLGKLVKIPVICVLHLPPDSEGFIRNLIDKYTFSLAKEVITVSSIVTNSLLAKKWVNKQFPIHTIANGINSAMIVEKAKHIRITRQDLSIAPDDIVIGTVARLIPRKNIDLLVQSFASLNYEKIKLLIIGYGPEEIKLRLLINDLNLNKKITMLSSGKSALSYYPLFDFFVLPSQEEGLSIALLEAMCFSLPCIVSSQNGQHPVITHGYDGIICKLTQLSIAQSLHLLLTDCKLARKIADQALVTLNKNYNQQNMVQAYKEICKKYINA